MNHPSNKPIGVFDSGIGGLTVTKELHRRLPGEEIIYLGDTARVPYGTKSAETVQRYALESTLYLLNRGVKMVVIACNTVSAVALAPMKTLLRAPLIGVLEPGVTAALNSTRNKRIGVIGTPSTIASGAYQNRLKEQLSDVQVWDSACPLLVPLAEEGRLEGAIVTAVLEEYLRPLMDKDIDTLILGCTHYPLFKPVIQRIMGETVNLVDSAETTAREVENVILREGLLATRRTGNVHCYATDIPREIDRLGKLFFEGDLGEVRKVKIDE